LAITLARDARDSQTVRAVRHDDVAGGGFGHPAISRPFAQRFNSLEDDWTFVLWKLSILHDYTLQRHRQVG
jgi:hypothetical protein